MAQKKQFYLVVRGRNPGLYQQWSGEDGASAQVTGFPGALYKGFSTIAAAHEWVRSLPATEQTPALQLLADYKHAPHAEAEPDQNTQQPLSRPATFPSENVPSSSTNGIVMMYTDGSALGNPGPGGYGVVLRYKDHYKEFTGGFRLTTNNRMELMACIVGLRALKRPVSVRLHSDSRYVVDAFRKGWIHRWQAQNWMRSETEPVKNADLWAELRLLCEGHQVEFVWVPSHQGVPDNERCHELAIAAAAYPDLPPDIAFEMQWNRT